MDPENADPNAMVEAIQQEVDGQFSERKHEEHDGVMKPGEPTSEEKPSGLDEESKAQLNDSPAGVQME